MPESEEASRPSWKRQDLLRVSPDVWASIIDCSPWLADLPLIGHWANRGWPVVVRRRSEPEDQKLVPVGVPLPPAFGKRRVALLIPPNGILQRFLSPALRSVANVAFPGWRSTIDALLAVSARSDVEPSVFGSLLWQHLTGLAYLTPRSDLDLLWRIPNDFDVLSLVSRIAEVQKSAPLRIDGEVIFQDGSAANWRELWNAYQCPDQRMVLAKTMEGVRLLDIATLPGIGQHA